MNSLKKYFPDYVIFMILFIIGMKISFQSENITDIDPFDESIYLFRGITLSPFIKHHIDGFVYYLWYNVLSVFTADNFELFFLNNNILLILPGLLIFLLLRILRVNLLIAFLAALIFLFSSANIFVIPLITKFALCVILSGLMIIYKINDPRDKILGAVFLSFILIYIRPEFILTLFITAGIYIYCILKDFRVKNFRDLTKGFLPLAVMIVIMFLFNPVSRHRVNVAFSQHYAKDILERNENSEIDLDLITKPEEIMRRDFSTDISFSEAVFNNPVLFFEHVGFNILRSFDQCDDYLPYFFVFDKDFSAADKIFKVFCIISLLAAVCFIIIRVKRKRIGIFSLIFASFVMPPLFSVLTFYPRIHYLILIFAFLLIFLSYEISGRLISGKKFDKFSFPVSVVTGILIIILLPFRAGEGNIHLTECTRIHTAKVLNKFDFKSNVNFFAVGPGILTFLTNDWSYVSDETLELPVDEFFRKKNVNLILVNNYFFNHPLIVNNSEIEKFLNDTSFVRFEINGCESYLMARKDILK